MYFWCRGDPSLSALCCLELVTQISTPSPAAQLTLESLLNDMKHFPDVFFFFYIVKTSLSYFSYDLYHSLSFLSFILSSFFPPTLLCICVLFPLCGGFLGLCREITHTHAHTGGFEGAIITLTKRLIIKFKRDGVAGPHHSAAMRQVVTESLTGGDCERPKKDGRRMRGRGGTL